MHTFSTHHSTTAAPPDRNPRRRRPCCPPRSACSAAHRLSRTKLPSELPPWRLLVHHAICSSLSLLPLAAPAPRLPGSAVRLAIHSSAEASKHGLGRGGARNAAVVPSSDGEPPRAQRHPSPPSAGGPVRYLRSPRPHPPGPRPGATPSTLSCWGATSASTPAMPPDPHWPRDWQPMEDVKSTTLSVRSSGSSATSLCAHKAMAPAMYPCHLAPLAPSRPRESATRFLPWLDPGEA